MVIRLATGVSAMSLMFFFLIAISFSMIAGVGIAYEIEDPENTTVEWNGTHLQMGPETVEFLPEEGEDWDDFEPDDRRDKPEEQAPEEIQPYLDEIEERENFGPDLSGNVVSDSFDATMGAFMNFAINSMLTIVGVLGSAYAEFFFNHKDRIPEWLAEAYVWTYLATLHLSMFYGKIRAIRS